MPEMIEPTISVYAWTYLAKICKILQFTRQLIIIIDKYLYCTSNSAETQKKIWSLKKSLNIFFKLDVAEKFTLFTPECLFIENIILYTWTHGDSLYELCTMGAEGGSEVDLQVEAWRHGYDHILRL